MMAPPPCLRLLATLGETQDSATDGLPSHENYNMLEVGDGRIAFVGDSGSLWYHPTNVRRVATMLEKLRSELDREPRSWNHR